jgi:hypothetical protein
MFSFPGRAPGIFPQAVSEADGKGVTAMSAATVLRVFKNSSLITEQGEFKISRVFNNGKAAIKARYHYHCTENGIAIYARRNKKGAAVFAIVDK